MSTEILVSIIVPVYNMEKYLSECLDSLFNQSLEQYEIIIVNDGSTDGSLDIIKTYQKKYSFIHTINQKNQGLSAARNAGLSLASGEYIYFMDSDDYLEKDALGILYDICKKSDLDAIFFDAESFVDQELIVSGESVKFFPSYNREKSFGHYLTGEELFYDFLISDKYYPSACLYMVKRDLYEENKLYFKRGILHEDQLFTPKLMCFVGECYHINEPFFRRRIRENSIMTSSSNKTKLDNLTIILSDLADFYKCHEFTTDKGERASVLNLNSIYRSCLEILREEQNSNKIQLTLDLKKIIDKYPFVLGRNQLYANHYKIYQLLAKVKQILRGVKK